jgi:hypothetical protein
MSYYDRDKYPNDLNANVNTHVGGQMGWPSPHVGMVGEYQVSGFPFAYTWQNADPNSANADYDDNTVIKVDFPFVTRWIKVVAHQGNNHILNDEVFVGFHDDAFDNGCYVDLKFASEQRLEIKTSSVYFKLIDSSKVDHIEILAGLTNIPASSFASNHVVPSTTTRIAGLNIAPSVTTYEPPVVP